MIEEAPALTFKAAWSICLRFMGGFLVLGVAWFFWQITSPLYWGFALPAILGGLGGGIHLIGTTWLLGQHLYEARRWRRKARAMPQQRGDNLASPDRYDEMGMR